MPTRVMCSQTYTTHSHILARRHTHTQYTCIHAFIHSHIRRIHTLAQAHDVTLSPSHSFAFSLNQPMNLSIGISLSRTHRHTLLCQPTAISSLATRSRRTWTRGYKRAVPALEPVVVSAVHPSTLERTQPSETHPLRRHVFKNFSLSVTHWATVLPTPQGISLQMAVIRTDCYRQRNRLKLDTQDQNLRTHTFQWPHRHKL